MAVGARRVARTDAAQLTVQDRWAVIAYVRALQLSQNAPLTMAPASERDRLQRESRH